MTRAPLTCWLVLCICILGLRANVVFAQVFDEQYSHWPEDLKIKGRVIVNNGAVDFESMEPLLQRVAQAGDLVFIEGAVGSEARRWADQLKEAAHETETTVIGSSNLPVKQKLAEIAIDSARCVLIHWDDNDAGFMHSIKPALKKLLARGGTLVVDEKLGEQLGRWQLVRSDASEAVRVEEGLNLLPDCLLVCAPGKDPQEGQERVLDAVSDHPRTVGITLESETSLVLSGRVMTCYGPGKATFVLPPPQCGSARVESISQPRSRGRLSSNAMIDLTQWRRDAIDRDLPPFPAEHPATPRLDDGTLLIVGGGGSPRGLMRRFIELAGGTDRAKLVYVPCSESEEVGRRHGIVESWKRMGIKDATFIHTKDRRRADSDEAFLEPLRDATGIFFGGGRQWNFSDSYYGTTAHKLMKEVLQRGGVIAGSSAGASIQARYLARATPIGNFKIMAPGYERGGLGFISGVAIDQHFSQRGRQRDMTELMGVHPQLLGIGLDEATAIEVQKSVAKVFGRGRVFFYDAHAERDEGEDDYTALSAGASYDLAARKVLGETATIDGEGKL